MTDAERYSSGELLRNIELIRAELREQRAEQKEDRHRLADHINRILVHQGEDRTRIDAMETSVADLQKDMRGVRRYAALLSGGIVAIWGLVQFLWGRH